jgi:hypothetical protein
MQQMSLSYSRDSKWARSRGLGKHNNKDGFLGALGTDEDFTAILDYLVKFFSTDQD